MTGLSVDGMALAESDVQRFLSKIMTEPNSGCWLWTDVPTKDGYGMMGVGGRKGKKLYAHRISYTLYKGTIPPRYEPDHLCRNRACSNPDHLEAVTRRINLLRGMGASARHAAKTMCLRGHQLPPYIPGKSRQCRPCSNDLKRQRRSQRRSA
jgi:hypothetical protein